MSTELIVQHAEETTLLWPRREAASLAPHYAPRHLEELDERLEAHLDGLRVAGNEAWPAIERLFGRIESGELFTAASLAFGHDAHMEFVLASAKKFGLWRPLVGALAWLEESEAAPHIERLLKSPDPFLRDIGIAAAAAHRIDPGKALLTPSPRAIKAIGVLGRRDLAAHVRSLLPEFRFAAARTLVLLGFAQEGAEHLANEEGARIAPDVLRDLTPRLAIVAAGSLGDPECIPRLIEDMKSPPLARAAGEAFSMITGADLEYETLDAPRPAGFESGPTDDPADENVDLDPDEDLPWPHVEKIRAWWADHPLPSGKRFLCGRPRAEPGLTEVLATGYQRQRYAAAVQLVRLSPGRPLVEVRARRRP